MSKSHHGRYEKPTKSAYSFERYDFGWELEYMEVLEAEPEVEAWTKNHGIRIPYIGSKGVRRNYLPDFLIRRTDGSLHLDEVKGGHLIDNADTKAKFEAAKKWCAKREITFNIITKE